jgi:imidazolonepropionase-like amidohydrolase
MNRMASARPTLLLLLLALVPRASLGATLAITDVTVIDPGSPTAQPNRTVIVTSSRITALGPAGEVAVPRGARVIDGAKKFLIPGLWDMHVHLSDATEAAFPLLVVNGIAGVRDLGGDLAELDRWRAEIARGTRLGPLIVRSGPFVDGPKDATRNRLAITEPEDARRAVDSLAALGVDGLKVHNKLPRAAFFAVLDQARKRNLPVAVHLPEGVTLAEASDSGAASIEHIEMVISSAAYRPGATAKTWDDALQESLGEAGARLFATLVRNRTYYDPTLTAYYHGFVHWEGQDTSKVRKRRLALSKLMAVTGDMHRAGVRLLAGSDFGEAGVGVRPGVDLHDELARLVEVGLTPLEALRCATLHPARYLGGEDSLGTIATGKRADLVLLTANPLENINNTRTIEAVVLGGRLVDVPAPRPAAVATKPRR